MLAIYPDLCPWIFVCLSLEQQPNELPGSSVQSDTSLVLGGAHKNPSPVTGIERHIDTSWGSTIR